MKSPTAPAVYARISLDAEGDGKAVQRQLEDCRKAVADNGWPEATEYVDSDVSGYSGKTRPEYERMLADIASRSVDAVVCYNLDRLTRQPKEFERFNDCVKAAGITNVVFVTGGMDLGTDDGLLIGRIYAAVAAQESAAKSRRIKRKNDEKAAHGLPHSGYRRPYGFEPDKTTQVPSEVRIIRTMATQYLAGKSVKAIARWLDERSILTVSGNRWNTSSVRGILLSPRIAGLREHRGEIVGPAAWKPIITQDKHALILAEAERRAVSGRRAPRRYLLSGLLRCGRCDNKLYSAARESTRRYVCSSSVDHGGCGKLPVVAAPLEELIADAVLVRLDSPELEDALSARQHTSEDVSTLSADRDADRAQLLELSTLYAEKQITTAEWIDARNRIEARINQADRRLRRVSSNPVLSDLTGQGGTLRTSWANLDLDVQSTIVGVVLDHAVISPGVLGARVLDPGRVALHWRL